VPHRDLLVGGSREKPAIPHVVRGFEQGRRQPAWFFALPAIWHVLYVLGGTRMEIARQRRAAYIRI
jgi:hypothetical protein